MKKRLFSLILALVLSLSLASALAPAAGATAKEMPFTDVSAKKWYFEPVKAAWRAGLMNGMTEDVFDPNGPMTRAQFVTILARLSGEDVSGMGEKLQFSDVKSGKFYSAALGWAVSRGLVKGYFDNTFKPGDPILRQELAAMIVRYFSYKNIGISGDGITDSFADAESFPKWAREDIDSLRLTGLIRGDEKGNFNPKNKTTRAEIATVLSRFTDEMWEQNRYDRVVLIGVDGAGTYFRQADTPNLDRIFENGSVAYDVLTSIPTISAQCWGSLLHGVTPEFHRLTNSVVMRRAFSSDSLFPSVFRVIRENDPEADLASFCNWTPVNSGIIEEGLGIHKDGGGDGTVANKVCEYVKEHDPKLLFVHFDGADSAGHNNGFGSEKQLEMISQIDGYIGRIYDAYAENGLLEKTLFLVTADHGGDGTSHGGTTDTEKYVMFAAAGYTVEKGAAKDMAIRDGAAVVLYALGYGRPDTWTARVPAGIFKNVSAERRPEYELDYTVPHRTHENVPTPPVDELKDALGDHTLRAYLPMDGGFEETVGGYETKRIAKLYYTEGFFGGGITYDDGTVLVKDIGFGKDSFSVCFWMKAPVNSTDDAIPIFGNRRTEDTNASGFILFLRADDLRLSVNNADESEEFDFVLPQDSPDGWVHVAMFIDRENERVGLSYDFGEFTTFDLPEKITGMTLDGLNLLNIGNDGEGSFWFNFPGTLDDFMIIDGILTGDDLDSLADHYGVK